jgi:hypothetical protein
VVAWYLLGASVAFGQDPGARPYLSQHLEHEGIGIDVVLTSVTERAPSVATAQQQVELTLSLRRLADGQPLPNLALGAWLDREVSPLSGSRQSCGQRIAGWLGSGLLARPLLDLTGYWVLTLDQEGSVSVLDPAVSFGGRTSLYRSLQLGGAGFDWVQSSDERSLFVVLPEQRQVVHVDLASLTIVRRVELPGRPTRVAMQPDQRLLWVGVQDPDSLLALDPLDGRVVHRLPLPEGHHELAFAPDGNAVYATSRVGGTLSVVDGGLGTLREQIALGGQPLGVLALAEQVWVFDGLGVVHRLDLKGTPIDRVQLERGLGPARVTPDQKHVVAVNPAQQRIYVLDAATGAVRKRATLGGGPYDIFFSERYGYVRGLETPDVAVFPLAKLPELAVQRIPTGSTAPGASADLPIASTMSANYERAGAFVVAPGERTIYHYMEGMNAPSTGLRAYGQTPLAVLTTRRGLREQGRGRYRARFTLPASGKLVLALASESPRVRLCLPIAVAPAAVEPSAGGEALRAEWLDDSLQKVRAGEPFRLHFRLAGDASPAKAPSFTALAMSGAGGRRVRLSVTHQRGREYRVSGELDQPGGYFVHLAVDHGEQQLAATAAPAAVLVLKEE